MVYPKAVRLAHKRDLMRAQQRVAQRVYQWERQRALHWVWRWADAKAPQTDEKKDETMACQKVAR